MPTISITVPSAAVPRIVAALQYVGFQRETGESDQAYYKRWIRSKTIEIDRLTRAGAARDAVATDDTLIGP